MGVIAVEDARAAIQGLAKAGAVDTVLCLNQVRTSPDLALTRDYQKRFKGYYIPGPRDETFYYALFRTLNDLATGHLQHDLGGALQTMFDLTGKRHLSFCSKLLATVADDAVVFDKNVAIYFDLSSKPLPSKNWKEEAVRRYEGARKGIQDFVGSKEWAQIASSFDTTFKNAVHLPDIRKADLIVWKHIALQ